MMAFISAITWGVGKIGFEVDTETLLPMVGPMWGYIAAQAGADWGKEKEKVKASKSDESDEIPGE